MSERDSAADWHLLEGDIVEGRCLVEALYIRKEPDGWVPLVPPVLVRVDTSIRSAILTPAVARDLHLKLRDTKYAGVRVTDVCFQLNLPGGQRIWLEEVRALVPDDADACVFGMAQILQWRFEIDGPARRFRISVPKPPER